MHSLWHTILCKPLNPLFHRRANTHSVSEGIFCHCVEQKYSHMFSSDLWISRSPRIPLVKIRILVLPLILHLKSYKVLFKMPKGKRTPRFTYKNFLSYYHGVLNVTAHNIFYCHSNNTRLTHLLTLPVDKSEFRYKIYAIGWHACALNVYFSVISNNGTVDEQLLRQEHHYCSFILGPEKYLNRYSTFIEVTFL